MKAHLSHGAPRFRVICGLLVRRAMLAAAVVATGAGYAADTATASQPSLTGNAATGGNSELAEFIVNLSRYATWPADPARRELTICFAHGGALPASATVLDEVVPVKGLAVATRMITTPQQVSGCNVVWLNSDVRPAPRFWLAGVSDRPVLTISNYADFTADGGIVGAYRLNGDWRFEINLEALQRSRISISAAALRLSQKPKAGRAGGEAK